MLLVGRDITRLRHLGSNWGAGISGFKASVWSVTVGFTADPSHPKLSITMDWTEHGCP